MAVSREEYLKRYLSGPTQEKKKSRKKASKAVIRKAGLKILDDDVDFKSLLPNNIKNSLDDDLADDNPVVIDLGLDDRPEQIKELERMRNSKRWKAVAQDKDDSESLQQPKLEEEIRKEREAVKRSSEHSNSSSDMRKIEKKRYDSESDASPASSVRTAQQERHFVGNDTSIGKRRRQDSVSSSDKSPPRQRQDSTDGSDNSPKRRRLDSAGSVDNSRPRQTQGRRAGFSNSSPSRKRKDSADNEDNSPRRKQGRNLSSDNSPRRKQGRDPSSDNSPPRRRGKDSADSVNNSPPRRRHNRGTHSDSSPPRRRKDGRADSDSDISPPRKENKSALHSFQQKKDRTYQSQDATNNPQVIYRKDGKKRDLQAEKKSKEEEEAKKAALAAKYKEWNKGLKQKEIVQERIADALNVVQKPLARYRDDQDLDSHLRAQLHQEDPMLAFIKKKKSSAKGGEKPRYRGPQPPPNRFNIEPGYRWDGVDRSSGFEKKFFSKLSEDKAKKDVAYKWSVEDM